MNFLDHKYTNLPFIKFRLRRLLHVQVSVRIKYIKNKSTCAYKHIYHSDEKNQTF
jgi:hypothetical protein